MVKRGDLLAVLDNVSLDANAERASAERRRLEQQVMRTRELFEQGGRVSSRAPKISNTSSRRPERRTARRASTFGETRLLAPFDGVVAARDIRVGEYAASSVAAFQVVDLSALRVVASLPERDLSRVRVGQTAKLISAYDDAVWTTGSVSRIAPIVDSMSGTFRVTLSLAPEQQVLRPGQFVSVELEVERREDVAVVPRKSIVYEDGRAVVYRMIPAPPPEEEETEEEVEESPWYAKFFGSSEESSESAEEDKGDGMLDEPEEKFVAEPLRGRAWARGHQACRDPLGR